MGTVGEICEFLQRFDASGDWDFDEPVGTTNVKLLVSRSSMEINIIPAGLDDKVRGAAGLHGCG